MKVISHQILRFLVLIAIQIFVFSRISLLDFGISFIYIYFLLFLPLDIPKWLQLVLAFLTGYILDVFVGTPGMHTISATVLAASREPLLRYILPTYNEEDWVNIDLFQRSMREFVSYTFMLSLLYCMVYFALDFFSIYAFPKVLFHVAFSTLFTFVCLFIYRYVFAISLKPKE